jgi:hypothetical protein
MLYTTSHIELAVICIDYSDGANVTISKTHSYEWVLPDSHCCFDVALDGNQIGMIIASEDESDIPLALVYCNHHDKIIHCINTQLLRILESSPCCLIHAGQFYIVSQNKLAVEVSQVWTDSSSSQSLPPSIRGVAQVFLSHSPRGPHKLRSPIYDVFGVSQGSLLPDVGADPLIDTPTNRVYFWPAIDTGAGLNLGPTCSYKHDGSIEGMSVGSSERFAVIWSYDHGYSFGLIHYVAHPTPHTTFHLLDIPPDVPPNVLESFEGFALDDSLGVLYLQISIRTIAVLSFA